MLKNKMKNTFLLLGLLYFFSSCSHKVYDSLEWQSNKVAADGKISEWSNPLRFYDDKSKLNYTIANDRKNLYICFKVSDETAQTKILRAGIEIKIDTMKKKLFPTTLVYPMANIQNQERKKDNPQSGNNPDENNQNGNGSRKSGNHSVNKMKLLSQAKDVQLFGFKPPLGGIMPLYNNTSGISVGINLDSTGVMYYELTIPFSTFYKNELTAADSNKVFNYRIKINALPIPQSSHEGGGGGRGMGGGGMGGMGGGGMRGGGMHGGGGHGGGSGGYSGNSELYSSNQITIKMRFSYK